MEYNYLFIIEEYGKYIYEIFSNRDALIRFVSRTGKTGPAVFFILQVIQVILSPIPGGITSIAGGILFGKTNGFILNFTSIIAGSCIAFFLARKFGQPLVSKMIKAGDFKKYSKVFNNKKYTTGLFLFFLFPFFPDDVLCFLAGLTGLSFTRFFLLIILGRTPGIIVGTLVGAELFILSPKVWFLLGIGAIFFVYLFYRYEEILEKWIDQKLKIIEPDKS